MNKKTTIVSVIVIAIAIVVFLIVSQVGTSLHIENRNVPDEKYAIWIIDVDDCNVSVSFTNDTNLFYAFDVKLSSVAFIPNSYSIETLSGRVIFSGSSSVVSVDLTLGTGINYDIIVRGGNLTTTITYSNGALINNNEVTVLQCGSFTFNLDEDVIATGNLDITIRDSYTTDIVGNNFTLHGEVFEDFAWLLRKSRADQANH